MSELDPTGNQQDCLGMTPIGFIMEVEDEENYFPRASNYPTNCITEDAWGHYHYCMHFRDLHQGYTKGKHCRLLLSV
jgi:hypothetical protein